MNINRFKYSIRKSGNRQTVNVFVAHWFLQHSGPLHDCGNTNGYAIRDDHSCRPIFNLYGCVCHFGSIHGGHYTSYSKHLTTGQWNYFDDGTVTEKKIPGFEGGASGDYSSAYILFYQRAGSTNTATVSINQQPTVPFGGGSFQGDVRTCSNMSLTNGSLFDSRLFSDKLPIAGTSYEQKSRNRDNEDLTSQDANSTKTRVTISN